ncbi:TniQ family protein [Paraburkholderia terrae]|uniref:TniQ family protein n=1 Tax=Paraburkholderia terrae TaxID=311230 RepID=UPI0037CC6081
MAIFLSEPLLDEPLSCVVGRYVREMQAAETTVLNHVFGKTTYVLSLGSNLNHVARETKDCWGLSALEIAERMTCFPYYAALCDEAQVDRLRASILSSGTRNNRLRSDSQSGPRMVRFCKECFADDLRNGERRHWRRVHQLRGVCICPWHECILWQMEIGRAIYKTPEDISDSPIARLDLGISRENWSACLEVARVSYGLLTSRITVYPDTFWEHCQQIWRGRIFRNIRLTNSENLHAALESFFGREYLSWCKASSNRVKSFATKAPAFWIVLMAVACNAFQDSPFDDSLRLWYGKNGARTRTNQPAVFCVNRCAGHGPHHVVDYVRFHADLYHAQCSCGIRFVFRSYEGQVPREVRVSRYGLPTLAYLRHLMAQGKTLSDLAEVVGTSRSRVQHFIYNNRHRST